ncbi:MAG: hypothetical protein U0574_01525 [Phycisphaerales bacterium]
MIPSLVIATSMLLLGLVVWKTLAKQEENDPKLRRELDADDRRARMGRARQSRGE